MPHPQQHLTGHPDSHTADLLRSLGAEDCLSLYVPTTPNPTGGYFVMVPRKDCHELDMTVDHQTESQSGGSGEAAFAAHQHAYKGRKTFKVHLALKAGEKVILISCDGGQKYIVLDRWEAP